MTIKNQVAQSTREIPTELTSAILIIQSPSNTSATNKTGQKKKSNGWQFLFTIGWRRYRAVPRRTALTPWRTRIRETHNGAWKLIEHCGRNLKLRRLSGYNRKKPISQNQRRCSRDVWMLWKFRTRLALCSTYQQLLDYFLPWVLENTTWFLEC